VLFVSRALNPAKVLQASIDEGEHKITVTVDGEQLSLAIGKGGQNARLAAKLTGWNIDLISAADVAARREAESRGDVPVEELEGLTSKLAQKLVSAGIETANEVRKAGIEGLMAVEGIGDKTAEKILASAEAALVARAASVAESDAAEPVMNESDEGLDRDGTVLTPEGSPSVEVSDTGDVSDPGDVSHSGGISDSGSGSDGDREVESSTGESDESTEPGTERETTDAV
jgi:N utilization substance protein A